MRDVGSESVTQLIPPLLLFAVMIAAYAFQLRRSVKHVAQIKQLTGNNDMAWYGDQLPPDIPPQLLESLPASLEIGNSFSGLRHGERVVAFDYTVGWGR